MTDALVRAMPRVLSRDDRNLGDTARGLVAMGINLDAVAPLAQELQRVDQILKERRKEVVRGKTVALGEEWYFPAQTDREMAGVVLGMQMPEPMSPAQIDMIRKLAMIQFSTEYGKAVTVTASMQAPMFFSGVIRTAPEVVYRLVTEGEQPMNYEGYCCKETNWAFDFLATPELIEAQTAAQRDYEERRAAGEDPKIAAKNASEKAMAGGGR